MISRKRKINDEGRMFNDKRFGKYFAIQQNEKAIFLISQIKIACLKQLSVKRHYNSIH